MLDCILLYVPIEFLHNQFLDIDQDELRENGAMINPRMDINITIPSLIGNYY